MKTLLFLLILNLGFSYSPTLNYLRDLELSQRSSGLEGIDCIYVINLDRRSEKWARMQELCREEQINPNRVSAVNGWQLSSDALAELGGEDGLMIKPGEVGCLLSHISVVKDALQRSFDRIWVMEDDVEFLGSAKQIAKLVKELSEIDPEWDLFYTDGTMRVFENPCLNSCTALLYDIGIRLTEGQDYRFHQPRPGQSDGTYFKEREIINDDLMRVYRRFGTHSMVISRRGLEKIYAYFSEVNLRIPIDWDLHYIPSFRQYAARKNLVTNELTHCITDCRTTN